MKDSVRDFFGDVCAMLGAVLFALGVLSFTTELQAQSTAVEACNVGKTACINKTCKKACGAHPDCPC